MLILGISSADRPIEAALIDGEKTLAEIEVASTEELVVAVGELFKKSGRTKSELSAAAVTEGPGSYSGLRGGIAVAKGLAQGLGVPAVGISTLDAVAVDSSIGDELAVVSMPARGGELNAAVFSGTGSLRRMTEDFVVESGKLEEVVSRISGRARLVSGVKPRASAVARLAAAKLKGGCCGDPLALAPVYSHSPNIREFNGDKVRKL